MQALVNTGPGKLEWKAWPRPEAAPGQVRIRTGACGICATDLEMIAGWQRTGFPAIPGHEWSGVVDAVGPGGNAALVGQRCVAENVWADGFEVGFEHPGGYGQYLLTEERNVRLLPPDFPLAVAALIEPLAVCVRALKRLRLERRDSALILGDGATGLLSLLLLKAQGVENLVLVGGRSARLKLAQEFGATAVLDYHSVGTELGRAVAALPGAPFPNVIEATSSVTAIETCLEVAAHAGKIVIIGDHGSDCARFPWNRILHGELELIGSNASAGAWDEAVRLAVSGRLPLEALISKRIPASEGAAGVELVRHSRDVVKVVMEWPETC